MFSVTVGLSWRFALFVAGRLSWMTFESLFQHTVPMVLWLSLKGIYCTINTFSVISTPVPHAGSQHPVGTHFNPLQSSWKPPGSDPCS